MRKKHQRPKKSPKVSHHQKFSRLYRNTTISNSDISSRESISRLNFSLIDEDLAFEIDDFEDVKEKQMSCEHIQLQNLKRQNLTAKSHSKIGGANGYSERTIMEEIQKEFQKSYLKTKVLSRQYQFTLQSSELPSEFRRALSYLSGSFLSSHY